MFAIRTFVSFSSHSRLTSKLFTPSNVRHNSICKIKGKKMNLDEVVNRLTSFASLSLAEDWDNVGLLIEPSAPHSVSRVLLTNDLTESVLDEAISTDTQLIVTYHPLIFQAVKKLTQKSWKDRIVTRCLEKRIAVFSPHTSWDAVIGGINDWLIQPFGGKVETLRRTVARFNGTYGEYRLEFTVPEEVAERLLPELSLNPALSIAGVKRTLQYRTGSNQSATRVCLNCDEGGLSQAVAYLSQFEQITNTIEVVHLDKLPLPGVGGGRLTSMPEALSLIEAVDLVKKHLGLKHVRLAKAEGSSLEERRVKSVAVCAGAGSSVLRGVRASLYITGEMSHHDLLDATQRGVSVILTEHSNSERGFLNHFKDQLTALLGSNIDVLVSTRDRDPVDII